MTLAGNGQVYVIGGSNGTIVIDTGDITSFGTPVENPGVYHESAPIYFMDKLARPLLVMHDGQNLFDDSKAAFGVSWGVLKALETLSTPQPVVIGAFNTEITRAAEYAPQDVLESLPDESYQFVGNPPLKPLLGNAYQKELAEEIIPHVLTLAEIDFRPERVAVSGSSMGGHASLYAMAKYPEIYGTEDLE